MNKYILTAWAFLVATCTPVVVLAADPVTDGGQELGENLSGRPIWVVILAIATWVVIRLWKDPALPGKLSPRHRAWAAMGVAVLVGITEALIRQQSVEAFFEGVQNGILAASGAGYFIQDLLITGVLGNKTEPPPQGGASGGTTTTTTTVATTAFLCLVLASVGCAGTSPLVAGADAHKHAVHTVDAAAPILREKCVEPMQRAAALEDATVRRDAAVKVATRCDVPVAAYEQARTSVVVLGAALTAAATGDLSRLPAAIASCGDAAVKLAMAIAQVIKQ